MSGQQSIIDRIIQESEERARAIIAEAQEEARELKAAAQEANEAVGAAYLERVKKEAEELRAARLRECELEIRRGELSRRFEAIDEAFIRARKSILSLSDKEYLGYIGAKIKEHASEGEEVVISKRDEKRITKEFIAALSDQLGIKLTLSKELGEFEGGVILRSRYWDKNLTIDTGMRFFREEYEQVISKMILGEE